MYICILGFILMFNFCLKLFGLIISQYKLRTFMTSQSQKMDSRQLKLTKSALKYTILCSISIIFTNLQFCGWAIFDLFDKDRKKNHWIQLIITISFNVVLFINFFMYMVIISICIKILQYMLHCMSQLLSFHL